MPLTLRQTLIQFSRIPPEFFSFRRYQTSTAATFALEYIVPDKRDLVLGTSLLHGHATGGETVISMALDVRRFNVPITEAVRIALLELDTPGAHGILQSNYGTGLYLPRQAILRGTWTFSAAVQTKEIELNLVGWLIPSYDLKV